MGRFEICWIVFIVYIVRQLELKDQNGDMIVMKQTEIVIVIEIEIEIETGTVIVIGVDEVIIVMFLRNKQG